MRYGINNHLFSVDVYVEVTNGVLHERQKYNQCNYYIRETSKEEYERLINTLKMIGVRVSITKI